MTRNTWIWALALAITVLSGAACQSADKRKSRKGEQPTRLQVSEQHQNKMSKMKTLEKSQKKKRRLKMRPNRDDGSVGLYGQNSDIDYRLLQRGQRARFAPSLEPF